MKKILVTIDGSENSYKALLEAKKYAKAFAANVYILNVVNTIVLKPYYMEQDYTMQTNNNLLEIGRKLLKDALKEFKDFECKVETIQKTGDPGEAIIEEIKDGDYDLIIMGSRGLGVFSRVMLGSISNKILNSVDTNVLIVK